MICRGNSKRYKAFDRRNNRTVMITKTPLVKNDTDVQREREVLKMATCPYIAQYFGRIVSGNEQWVRNWRMLADE